MNGPFDWPSANLTDNCCLGESSWLRKIYRSIFRMKGLFRTKWRSSIMDRSADISLSGCFVLQKPTWNSNLTLHTNPDYSNLTLRPHHIRYHVLRDLQSAVLGGIPVPVVFSTPSVSLQVAKNPLSSSDGFHHCHCPFKLNVRKLMNIK